MALLRPTRAEYAAASATTLNLASSHRTRDDTARQVSATASALCLQAPGGPRMGPEIAPSSPPPPPPAPRQSRRLTRSTRERMWAGVAGGMAEYFDLDPSLVRLIWVAAAVVTHGLAIPLYILAWIILPRDDRSPAGGQTPWRDWSQEFHAETQRLAEEARRVATEFQGPSSPSTASTSSTSSASATETVSSTSPPEGASTSEPQPATDKTPAPAPSPSWTAATTPPGPAPTWSASSTPSEPAPTWSTPTTPPEPAPSWSTPSDLDEPRRGGQPRTVGVVLVGLGAFLLAANAGWFAWFNWGAMWPLIFIGLGVILLARQFDWWGR